VHDVRYGFAVIDSCNYARRNQHVVIEMTYIRVHTFTVLSLHQHVFTFEYVLHFILLCVCVLRNCEIMLS